MAHLRPLAKYKCQTCGKPATEQLYGCRNVQYGYYCAKCGPKAVQLLNAREARGETGQ
jgi:DNA-directed RNA polymerase subunit RPC12/RpoP